MATDEHRSAARKAQIFEAAAAVFAQQGYHGARMDDIVRASGLSKGTLYWYFKSKEELATGLVHQMLAAESEAMRALLEDERPAAERLEELVRAFARALAKNPDKAPLALELLSLARSIPNIGASFSAHHEHYVALLRVFLAEICPADGRNEGSLDTAALAISSVIDGVVLRWTLASQSFDLEETLWDAVAVIVRGLQAPGT